MLLDLALLVLALLVLMLFALNAVCSFLFKRWPNLLLSENERLSIEYFSRFEGELTPHIPEWFDIKAEEWGDFVREYHHIEARGGHVYDDFTEIRHPEWAGRYLNFHQARFRHVRDQGPWPISPHAFNVFFFGGSTTVGVGPDWTTIPSYLQEELRRGAGNRPIYVYNFGCDSFFSTQERILFQQLLLANAVPDMVIFLDGVNDLYFFDGRPSIAGFFQYALDAYNRENYERKWNRLTAKPKWQKLGQLMSRLPLSLA